MRPKSGDGVRSTAPGLGQPFEEEYFWPGYRDPGQGQASPLKAVFSPPPDPNSVEGRDPGRSVFFMKRPANVEPPWFARQIIKSKNCLVVAPGATVNIFDRMVQERQRAIVTILGVDLAPLLPLMNGDLVFTLSFGGVVAPIWDDQSTGYCAVSQSGQTTVPLGAAAVPFCLFSNGMSFRVIGPKRILYTVENQGLTPVTLRGTMGWYEYWTSYGATEFENADVQL